MPQHKNVGKVHVCFVTQCRTSPAMFSSLGVCSVSATRLPELFDEATCR